MVAKQTIEGGLQGKTAAGGASGVADASGAQRSGGISGVADAKEWGAGALGATAQQDTWMQRYVQVAELLCKLGEHCDGEGFRASEEERKGSAGSRDVGGSALRSRVFPQGKQDGLLVERAGEVNLWNRCEAISFGGACQMMRTAQSTVAVNLPRPQDWESIPAWLHLSGAQTSNGTQAKDRQPADTQAKGTQAQQQAEHFIQGKFAPAQFVQTQFIQDSIKDCRSKDLVEAATELGLAVAEVASHLDKFELPGLELLGFELSGGNISPNVDILYADVLRSVRPRSLQGAKVADLTAMWAGPLCGDLLARAGAEVIKIESSSRPTPTGFLPQLAERKTIRQINFETQTGKAELAEVLDRSHIVLTSCRPRALEQLNIDPFQIVSGGGIWIAITGHGWDSNRVAFGDDAAVAGGLVKYRGDTPCFVGDAIADPLTGVFAAVSVLLLWLGQEPAFVDIPMAGVAAAVASQPSAS